MNGLKEEGWPTPGAATRPTADGSGGRTLQYLSGGQADGQDLALPVSDDWGRGRGLRARHRRRRVDESAERVWSSPEPQRISLFCSTTITL